MKINMDFCKSCKYFSEHVHDPYQISDIEVGFVHYSVRKPIQPELKSTYYCNCKQKAKFENVVPVFELYIIAENFHNLPNMSTRLTVIENFETVKTLPDDTLLAIYQLPSCCPYQLEHALLNQ